METCAEENIYDIKFGFSLQLSNEKKFLCIASSILKLCAEKNGGVPELTLKHAKTKPDKPN